VTAHNDLGVLLDAYGMSGSDIAVLLGIRLATLRRVRNGTSVMDDETQDRLDALTKFMDRLSNIVDDPASWMETAHIDWYSARPMDMYSFVQPKQLLDAASGKTSLEDVFDAAVPGWRERYYSPYESFIAADGYLSFRIRVPEDKK
jgi:hypothetical protein